MPGGEDSPEPESPAHEPAAPSGVLRRLQDEDMQKARRTIIRLHRNPRTPHSKRAGPLAPKQASFKGTSQLLKSMNAHSVT